MTTRRQVDRSHEMGLLKDLLDPNADKTLLLLEAGPGYGKSMLLERYKTVAEEGGYRCASIDLSPGANSTSDFLSSLCHQWDWDNFPSFRAAMARMSNSPANDINIRNWQIGGAKHQLTLPEDTERRQLRAQELTLAWFGDAKAWLENGQPFLILVDAYNPPDTQVGAVTVDSAFCNWLIKVFFPQAVKTKSLRLVLAGQRMPNHGPPNWESRCHRHQLGPITNPADWMELVEVKGAHVVDYKTVSAFCLTEQGHPWSIAVKLELLCNIWGGQ